jgi:hypothetical protein
MQRELASTQETELQQCAEGNIRLTLGNQSQQWTRSTNDLFTSATIIRGSSAVLNVNMFLATSELGEPQQVAPKAR